jgi:hypothetical protein
VATEPFALAGPQLLGLHDVDAGDGHLRPQRRKARLLVATEAGGEAVDLDQLLGGRQPVLAHLRDPGGDLTVEAGHAHHVELVEVGGGDRQEAQALEQRVAGILRLFQNPAIELQPGQLAIGEACRALRRGRRWRDLGRLHAFLQSGSRRAHG